MKIISIIIFSIILFGCSENKYNNFTNPLDSSDYVSGEVVVGLKDSISLEEFANYVYTLQNVSINEIVFFSYYSTLPRDSMQVIKSAFESKLYIWQGETEITYNDSLSMIKIKFWIKDFRSRSLEDWGYLKDRLNLIHIPSHSQIGNLKVETGKEMYWINKLSNSPLFYTVELDHRTHTY